MGVVFRHRVPCRGRTAAVVRKRQTGPLLRVEQSGGVRWSGAEVVVRGLIRSPVESVRVGGADIPVCQARADRNVCPTNSESDPFNRFLY
jgi:hypothetical protein